MTNRRVEQRIADIEAREAIKELRARYGWHAARGEYAGIVDSFAPDGVFELLVGDERRRLVGRDAIRAFLAPTMRPVSVIPLIHNHIIRVEGDEAYGTCAMETRVAPNWELGFVGYYHDRVRRYGDSWLFTERRWFFYRPGFEDSGLDPYGTPIGGSDFAPQEEC